MKNFAFTIRIPRLIVPRYTEKASKAIKIQMSSKDAAISDADASRVALLALTLPVYGSFRTSDDVETVVKSTSPYTLQVKNAHYAAGQVVILAGNRNTTAKPVSATQDGVFKDGKGSISTEALGDCTLKVTVNTTSAFVGARIHSQAATKFYGVWEYPFSRQLDNAGIAFDLKGVGNSEGINWANARAPFFFTDQGYGAYADTLQMGSFDFTQPGQGQFIFNSSSLVFYVILAKDTDGPASILSEYATLSNTIGMPPDSSYGPTFWSDNWEEDFHDGVTNAQENYYDVINHLYDAQIHATAMFADRPYGTGNYSFGNWDFDPVFYPTPREFIANLSSWGYDFQVWVANRAFIYTDLYNASVDNGWLFPGIDAHFFNGPAVNLSIAEAYKYFESHLEAYPSLGVKGYKIDRGEEEEMPVYEQNVQMTLFEQLCYDTMIEKWGEEVFYNFARSAVDRSRNVTAVWNGDSWANYTGLAYTVASGIRAGLIGFSQWGSDTGGYIREIVNGVDQPAEDLWARWMWFSAFSPVYEIMIGTNHTPWYPPYSSNLVQVLKDSTDLHHLLMPYIRSYTYHAHRTGIPVIRAALLEAPKDKAVYDINDAYFFGPHLYIAPIVNATDQRTVYFPKGNKYLEYFNRTEVHRGGSTTKVSLDTSSIPAYIREGSILAKGDIYQGNNKWTKDWQPSLQIEVFPSPNVHVSALPYYNGKEAVDVRVKIEDRCRYVTVEYGAVGINGTLKVFTKTGIREVPLLAGGGHAVFENVESLFGDS